MRRKERELSDIKLIEEIIEESDVCRIAIANGDIPYIVTMNFGYVSGTQQKLYFHCAKNGRKLDMIRKNKNVCFEMDIDHQIYSGPKGCGWGMKFRSVVGYGNISILTKKEERLAGLNSIMTHYGGKGDYSYEDKLLERTTILRLDITEMTGKKC